MDKTNSKLRKIAVFIVYFISIVFQVKKCIFFLKKISSNDSETKYTLLVTKQNCCLKSIIHRGRTYKWARRNISPQTSFGLLLPQSHVLTLHFSLNFLLIATTKSALKAIKLVRNALNI